MTGLSFQKFLKRLEARFGKEYHQDQVRLMWNRLKNYPEAAMDLATENIICEDKYLPGFNELRDHLKRVMAAAPRLKMENTSEAKVVINCFRCQDTGIKLRPHRKHLAKDYYCDCTAAKEITLKHDWTIEPWYSLLMRQNMPAAEFGKRLRRAAKTLKFNIVDVATGKPEEIPF